MRKKYVKEYLVLLRLLVSDFLLFNDLFWSSPVSGFGVLNPAPWVLGHGYQVLGAWVHILDYAK